MKQQVEGHREKDRRPGKKGQVVPCTHDHGQQKAQWFYVALVMDATTHVQNQCFIIYFFQRRQEQRASSQQDTTQGALL